MVKHYKIISAIATLIFVTGVVLQFLHIDIGRPIWSITVLVMFVYQGFVIEKLQKQLKEKVEKEKAE